MTQRRLEEDYFQWLKMEALSHPRDREKLDGVLRLLHDVPFYWTIWSDENRAGDALSFRQSDFLEFYDQNALQHLDQQWLGTWATASPSVFEVLMGIARRWSFYFEQPASYFFGVMITNMGLHHVRGKRLPERVKDEVRAQLDSWMSRQFPPDGQGSPFPVVQALPLFDMTQLDIWGQMNAYSAEHFQ